MLKTVGNPSTRYGDQTIVNGNLVIGTAGKGIDFSADPSAPGMTSELLDDYEEGTFTPILIGTSTSGTGTYSVQDGRYRKIGNAVFFSLQLTWSAHTGTGDMQIQGLPFTSISTGPIYPCSDYVSDITMTASRYLQSFVSINTSDVRLRQVPVGGGTSTAIPMDTAGNYAATGVYFTS